MTDAPSGDPGRLPSGSAGDLRRPDPPFVEVTAFLDGLLVAERFRVAGMDDPAGIWRPVDPAGRPVAAIGLLLAPWPGLPGWVAANRFDALVVHRPWGLPLGAPELAGVGVLAYHLAFDERLTLGFNPRLAAELGLTNLDVLGRKAGRPLGMLGTVPPLGGSALLDRLGAVFGGIEGVAGNAGTAVARLAVVGAMTEGLVREAVGRGADAYLTGQLRAPARPAVDETGLLAMAVGHARGERWGLRAMAAALRERWPGLRVVVREG